MPVKPSAIDQPLERGDGVLKDSEAFVGRERETAALRAALAEASAGRGKMVFLVGEPGIGKSRLAGEFARHAQSTGAKVLWGRCWEDEGAPPYWPWVQAVRSCVRECDAATLRSLMGAGAADVAEVVPEVEERLAELSPPPQVDPEQARFRLFDSITSFLRNAAAGEPLVVILDDLHWADRPSLLLLQFVARQLQDSRVLIVGTYRESEIKSRPDLLHALGEIARDGQRLALTGLSRQAVARYVQKMTGRIPSADLVEAVYSKTDGNPFFVTEVARLWLTDESAAYDLVRGQTRIPQGVREEIIGHRLARLSAACRRLVLLASGVGRGFSLVVLAMLWACTGLLGDGDEPSAPVEESRGYSDAGRARALAALDEAIRAGIIIRVAGALDEYGFSHAIVRDTIYEELNPAQRAQLHRRIGEALERLHTVDRDEHLAELAHHFLRAAAAGSVRIAVDYQIRAGRRAAALLAYEEAVRHYRHVLALLEQEPPSDGEEQTEVLLALGDAQWRAGEMAAARETFRRAAGTAWTMMVEAGVERAAPLLARAALGFGSGLSGVRAGKVDELVVALLEEALAKLPATDSPLRARLLARLGEEFYYSDRRRRCGELTERAVAMARRVGDPAALTYTLNARLFAAGDPDNLVERLAIAEEIIELAVLHEDKEMAAQARVWHLNDLLEAGNIPAADLQIEAAAELADELRQPRLKWQTQLPRGMRALFAGRLDEAEQLIQAALRIGERAQAPNALQFYGVQMFALRWLQGRLGEVADATQGFADTLAAVPAWRGALAVVYAETGQEAEARRELDYLARRDFEEIPRDANWIPALTLLSEVCVCLGDRSRAAQLYRLLHPYAGHNMVVAPALASAGCVARQVAMLAAMLERWDDAARSFERAIDMNAVMGARPYVARARHQYAAMLIAGGSRSRSDHLRATELLDRAIATYRELGMRSYLEQALDLSQSELPMGLRQRTVVVGAEGSRSDATGLDRSPPNVFRLEGKRWIVAWEGRELRLKNSYGLRYIAELLRRPNEEIHVRQLAALTRTGTAPTSAAAYQRMSPQRLQEEGLHLTSLADAGPVPDARAKTEYVRRLRELRGELLQAEQHNDMGRVAALRADIDAIEGQLGSALRRDRRVDDRVRKAVTNAIKRPLAEIQKWHPTLWRHLVRSIHTGRFCSYKPPTPTSWEL